MDKGRVNRMSLGAVCMMLMPLVRTASGQELRVPEGVSESELVAAAVSEAKTFPRSADDSVTRVCLVRGGLGPVSSGQFTIGGNLSGPPSGYERHRKIWWRPLHDSKDMPALVVRGRNITALSDTLRFVDHRIAWPVPGPGIKVPEAERRYFFPSDIAIPTPGRWLLIATSGTNWGCFILTVD